VKVLGTGEISKKLTVRVHTVSASAREKIEKAGGTVELLREPKARKPRQHHERHPAAAEEPQASAEEEATEE
jgi:large subunit ribosomal protein L15